ncbi:MAG: 6,7-dimethyl-8-ribityllumazine synthase [Chitinophagaceae bacterium]
MADISNSKLLQTDTGILHPESACIVIVKTEWNAAIVDELERGAIQVLGQQGVKQIIRLTVPGAVELPFAIRQYWERKSGTDAHPSAFIALGCVVRGDTPHFEYVCQSVTSGITQLNIGLPVPTVFGVLTVNTDEQAQERIGGKHGHKGEEAAITALKMIALNQSFS